MNRYVRMKVLLAFFLLPAHWAGAQEVAARLESDTSRIRIGESFTLRLQLSQPKGLDIPWPSWIDSLAGAEILRVSDVDTPVTNDNSILLRGQTVVLTSFDSGSLQIPSVQFSYLKSDGKKVVFQTDPLAVDVLTVQVDTTQAFRDIKGNANVPLDYRLIALWVAAILVFLGILFWLYKRFRRKKAVVESQVPETVVPPEVRALDELRRLDDERLWQSGYIKEYHTRLTDILRSYLFDRYQVNAPDMTTDDLVSHSLVRSLPTSQSENLERILRLADLVKFAKYTSLPDECAWGMTAAVNFITSTSTRLDPVRPATPHDVNGNVD